MSTPRLNLLDLPTEILSNIVECVHRQGINFDKRMEDGDPSFRRNDEALIEKTGCQYKYTLGSLYGTSRRLRELSTSFRFKEFTLRQSMHEDCGIMLARHRKHIRCVVVKSAPTTKKPELKQKDVSNFLSLLPSFPNFNELCLDGTLDWFYLSRILIDHSSPDTPSDPLIAMCISTLLHQVKVLTAVSLIPDQTNICLELFRQVRQFFCYSLSPAQQSLVANWANLKVLDLSYLDEDLVSLDVEWKFIPRKVCMFVNRLAGAGTVWPYISKWSQTLEWLEFTVQSDTEPQRFEPPAESFPDDAFPLLKRLDLDTRTSEVEYLLPLFASAPLVELVLFVEDRVGDQPGTPMESLLQPFLPTLRHIRLDRLYEPSLLPIFVTPSFLDFCHRHNIAITYRPLTFHVAYYRIFDSAHDDPQDVASVSRSDMVKGCEQLMDYQRGWLKRCVEMGDDAGLNELGALLRDTAVRFIADRD